MELNGGWPQSRAGVRQAETEPCLRETGVAWSPSGTQREGIQAQPSEALRLGQARTLLLCAQWGRPCPA